MEMVRFSAALDALIKPDSQARKLAAGYEWSEGPVWEASTSSVIFTDFGPNRIYRWNEPQGVTLLTEASARAVGLALDHEGRIISCESRNRRIARYERDGGIVSLASHYQGRRLHSPNDVIVKSDGAIYFTDPYSTAMGDTRELDHNGVYRIAPGAPGAPGGGGELTLVTAMDRPNGLAFSPDESLLYVDDTNRQLVEVFDVRADGSLGPGRILTRLDTSMGKGGADGMKVDVHGNLYVTGPGGLWVIAPDGAPAGLLRFPEIPANLCWGGPDLATLYVTATSSLYSLQMLACGSVSGPRRPPAR
jgi:gluconolactonase